MSGSRLCRSKGLGRFDMRRAAQAQVGHGWAGQAVATVPHHILLSRSAVVALPLVALVARPLYILSPSASPANPWSSTLPCATLPLHRNTVSGHVQWLLRRPSVGCPPQQRASDAIPVAPVPCRRRLTAASAMAEQQQSSPVLQQPQQLLHRLVPPPAGPCRNQVVQQCHPPVSRPWGRSS